MKRWTLRLIGMLGFALIVGLLLAPAAAAIRFTDDSYLIPEGTVGEYYLHEFKGEAGCGPPYHFEVQSGEVPPGLSLTSDGLLAGIPTRPGSWSFWLQLSDDDPPTWPSCFPRKSQRRFTVDVAAALVITTASAAPATLATPYSLKVTATGGSGALTWSIASGELPPRLTLNAATGEILGSPTTPGIYTFRVRVSDRARLASKQFTVPVREPLTARVDPPPGAEVGLPLRTVKAAASGGSSSKAWRLEGDLPRGLAFDAQAAAITGTPQAEGMFPLKLIVSDNEGRTADVSLTLVVSPKLMLTTTSLPKAAVGHLYQARIKARGGAGALRFQATSGLPPGIHLHAADGVLSGRPSAAGTYRLEIRANDTLGASATRTYILNVRR